MSWVLILTMVSLGMLVATPASAEAATCSAVEVAAGSWLGGAGVLVHSNGVDQGTGNSCAGLSGATPRMQEGYGWQCVELAARLYAVNGWGAVYADGGAAAGVYRYGAEYIPEGSPELAFHGNGGGYLPVPGDLIIESYPGGWGHVSVVDHTVGSAVYAVEQNASANGLHTYTLTGSTLSGQYAGSIRGVMHAPLNNATNGSPVVGPTPVTNGSFVSITGHPEVYRIAGGAPVYVSTWTAFGSPKATSVISQATFNAMPQIPADGTFVVGAQRGEVYRIAGGAPVYVSTWAAFGRAQATTTVDQSAIDKAGSGGAWNHLSHRPADGTFVVGAQRGEVYRIAGGAPVYVSTWAAFGRAQATTTVDQSAIDKAGSGGAWNHLSYRPADGTFVVGAQRGAVYRFAAGYGVLVATSL
jgi:CHAP domain